MIIFEKTKSVFAAMKARIVRMACPRTGSFYGYKKTSYFYVNDKGLLCMPDAIVVLFIPEDAKRSSARPSAFGSKCRCSKAKVIDIYNAKTGEPVNQTFSVYDPKFKYTVGETVSVDNFDENRFNECAPGIHFFMTKEEAMEYPAL